MKMTHEIIPFEFKLPYRMGSVNCYLIKTNQGFILVDTGSSNSWSELERKLEQCGCNSENLPLIVLTHGDFDHTGNAAYIKNKHKTKIAMHHKDSPMVELGNMFVNRKKGNIVLRWIVNTLFGFGKSQRFKPDIEITDGFDLTEYGLDARVIHIPGHSKGSIGILTDDGKLICGDLLENITSIDSPKINRLTDDFEEANKSIDYIRNLEVDIVYPGHGRPFTMDSFLSKLNS